MPGVGLADEDSQELAVTFEPHTALPRTVPAHAANPEANRRHHVQHGQSEGSVLAQAEGLVGEGGERAVGAQVPDGHRRAECGVWQEALGEKRDDKAQRETTGQVDEERSPREGTLDLPADPAFELVTTDGPCERGHSDPKAPQLSSRCRNVVRSHRQRAAAVVGEPNALRGDLAGVRQWRPRRLRLGRRVRTALDLRRELASSEAPEAEARILELRRAGPVGGAHRRPLPGRLPRLAGPGGARRRHGRRPRRAVVADGRGEPHDLCGRGS